MNQKDCGDLKVRTQYLVQGDRAAIPGQACPHLIEDGVNIMTKEEEIADQFVIWNTALQMEDPDNVVACYAADAVLLPTLSSKVRHNHAEIRDYFVHFLSKSPNGRIVEQNIRVYDDIAINSGLYTFSLAENGVRVDTAGRFTFVYRKYDDEWLIIEHHSSVLPA